MVPKTNEAHWCYKSQGEPEQMFLSTKHIAIINWIAMGMWGVTK